MKNKVLIIQANYYKDISTALLKSAIFELMYKPKISSKIIIKEYLNASNFFIDLSQTKYLNALLDKISKKLRN